MESEKAFGADNQQESIKELKEKAQEAIEHIKKKARVLEGIIRRAETVPADVMKDTSDRLDASAEELELIQISIQKYDDFGDSPETTS